MIAGACRCTLHRPASAYTSDVQHLSTLSVHYYGRINGATPIYTRLITAALSTDGSGPATRSHTPTTHKTSGRCPASPRPLPSTPAPSTPSEAKKNSQEECVLVPRTAPLRLRHPCAATHALSSACRARTVRKSGLRRGLGGARGKASPEGAPANVGLAQVLVAGGLGDEALDLRVWFLRRGRARG